jgi:hypothetical protein
MPVDAVHPEYTQRAKQWRRCRDAVAGEDAIKEAGKKYLPRLSGHTDDEYEAYKQRALWYNATARTVDGLTGLIFRKAPDVDAPDALADLMEDVTTDGLSLQEFAEMIVEETIVVGRGGILIDYPRVEVTDDESQADTEQRGDRPYATHYAAEAITNWKTGRIGNRTVITMVVLYELYEIAKDEFEAESGGQYRVLLLNESGQYQQQIWRKVKQESGKEEWTIVDEATPLLRGAPLDFIPFFFFGPRDASAGVTKPPVIDLVNMNISHYRTMADLENGRHWTGVPTPVFIGNFITEGDEEVTEVKLGSTSGIHLEADGSAQFLEFTGSGLQALENGAKSKEEYMAVLGARILAQEKRMVEAAETAKIHRAGESSVLSSLANAVSKVLSRAMTFLAEWYGVQQEVTVELNNDFMPNQMDAQMLTALLQAWQQQAIAFDDLVYAMKQGEIVREERTAEEIEEENQDRVPSMGALGGGGFGAE